MITLFQNKLNKRLDTYNPFIELLRNFRQKEFSLTVEGTEGFFFALVVERLFRYSESPFLIVTPTEQEAETLVRDLSMFTDRAYQFPWWSSVPYGAKQTQLNIAGKRMGQLVQMISGEPFIAVASLRAFLTPLPPPQFIRSKLLTLKVGQEFDPVQLTETLQSYRYLRVPKVTVAGEFALRGEVLDLFLPGNE
ncbi:MAG: transcription-repair coupling factor, partial [Spirochaetia bacterium]